MTNDQVLRALEDRLLSFKAKDMMTTSVITAKKEMLLADLAAKILAEKISGLPVVDNAGKLTGIITATDLFALMFMLKTGQMIEDGNAGVCNPTVDFAMCRDVIGVQEDTSLEEIMRIMWGRSIHSLPVIKGDKLVGIIGRRDVIKHFYAIVKDVTTK